MQDQYYMISGDRIVKFGMALVMAEMCSFVTTLLFQGPRLYSFWTSSIRRVSIMLKGSPPGIAEQFKDDIEQLRKLGVSSPS